MNKHLKNLETKQKWLSAPLSKELVEEYKVHSMPVREGDTVRILRGDFEGVEGKVTKVDSKKGVINVEGATREKADGTVKFVPIHPSKVAARKLSLDDSRRKDIIARRAISKGPEIKQ